VGVTSPTDFDRMSARLEKDLGLGGLGGDTDSLLSFGKQVTHADQARLVSGARQPFICAQACYVWLSDRAQCLILHAKEDQKNVRGARGPVRVALHLNPWMWPEMRSFRLRLGDAVPRVLREAGGTLA
jgi:hypothetical protein